MKTFTSFRKMMVISGALALVAVGGITVADADSASATKFSAPVLANCPAGKFVQMKFVIASGKVDIGWGVTEAAASTANADEAGHPWTLAKGTHSRNVGKRQLWYQIWSSPGEVKSHGYTCVLAG